MGASGPAKTEQKLTYVRFPSLSFQPTSLFYFPLGGVPTDEEQATGLEREVMLAARKGQDPYNMLAPKATSGTKEDPNVPRKILI